MHIFKTKLAVALLTAFTFFIFLLVSAFAGKKYYPHNNESWCDHPLRAGLNKLKEVKTSRPWFKVYDVGENTFAIDEPYNWEETIAYLIIGKDSALLFDTGMGLDSISLVVKELTKLPIVVINSHTHGDHIGGNSEFGNVLAMNTAYTKDHVVNGYPHASVQAEVSPSSFCLSRLPNTDTAHYFIHPFAVTKYISDGYTIALGGRTIKVLWAPGHAPDAICLFDTEAGYLWCGDSFYEGPIFLFSDSTNLKQYGRSIHMMASLAQKCKYVLPSHNLPLSDPKLIINAAKNFDDIIDGKKKGKMQPEGFIIFPCGEFSFQIGEKYLKEMEQQKHLPQ